jgi:ribonuclease Z
VNKVFVTHLHSDHIRGLSVLWMGAWNQCGANPLPVWGPGTGADQPAGTAALAAQLTTAFAANTHIRRDLVEHGSAEGITINAREGGTESP